jgi:hypothetical protein
MFIGKRVTPIPYSALAEITVRLPASARLSRCSSKEQTRACRRCRFMSDQHHNSGHHSPITYLIILLAAACAFAALYMLVLQPGAPIMPAPG